TQSLHARTGCSNSHSSRDIIPEIVFQENLFGSSLKDCCAGLGLSASSPHDAVHSSTNDGHPDSSAWTLSHHHEESLTSQHGEAFGLLLVLDSICTTKHTHSKQFTLVARNHRFSTLHGVSK